MKTQLIKATDNSGDYAIVIQNDDDSLIELQEYDKDGQLIQRVYGEAIGAQ